MSARTRTVADVDGHRYEVQVEVLVWRDDVFAASVEELREVLPGPVRERLIDELRDDVEALL